MTRRTLRLREKKEDNNFDDKDNVELEEQTEV